MSDPRGGNERPAASAGGGGRGPGRPRNPVVGYGPTQRFARMLRDRLQEAGNPRRTDHAKGRSNATTIGQVDGGRFMPKWTNTEHYLIGCGADTEELGEWRSRHDEHCRRAALFRPDLEAAATVEALLAALRDLLAAEGIDEATLEDRRVETAARPPAFLPKSVPSAGELLTAGGLLWTVYLAGGTLLDVEHWQRHLQRVQPVPPAGQPPVPERIPAPRRRVPVAALIAAVAVVVAVVVVVVSATQGWSGRTTGTSETAGPGTSPASSPAASVPPAPVEPSVPPGNGTAELLSLAQRVERSATPMTTGRYAHLYRRLKVVDTTDKALTETRIELRLSWAMNGPGRRVQQKTVGRRTGEPEIDDLPHGPPEGAGPPSTDPVALKGILSTRGTDRSATFRLVLGAGELSDTYPLSPAQRAAVLRMLAAEPGVVFRGQAVDAENRPGIAVSADDEDGTRITLIFSTTDGRLLGRETADNVPGVTGRIVSEEVVYLESGFSDRLD